MTPQFLTTEEVLNTVTLENLKAGECFEKREYPKQCVIDFDQFEETFTIWVSYGKKFEETIEEIESLEEAIKEINNYLVE